MPIYVEYGMHGYGHARMFWIQPKNTQDPQAWVKSRVFRSRFPIAAAAAIPAANVSQLHPASGSEVTMESLDIPIKPLPRQRKIYLDPETATIQIMLTKTNVDHFSTEDGSIIQQC